MKINTLSLASLAGILSLTATAAAQSFNVDFGASATTNPTAAYGAASGQTGTWQTKTAITSAPLTDITGAVTTATLAKTTGTFFGFAFNNAGTSGDDQNLMDDLEGNDGVWTFGNLAAGNYTVYTYAFAPDDATFISGVSVNGGPVTQVGGAWPSGFVLGVTHAVDNVVVAAGGSIAITLSTISGAGSIDGVQIIKNPPTTAITSSCFGDGTSTACPCVPGAPGNGCPNNASPGGANLSASGVASIAADSMVLSGSGMPGTSSVLYFQANTNGSPGTVFGDGVRCAVGTTVRLGTKANSGGASSYPGMGDPSISVKGGDVAGDVRYYQAYYRDANPSFCTTATFNISNMVSWTWAP